MRNWFTRSWARRARLRLAAHGAAAVLALVLTAPSAHGQITNRLKKMAKDAAKNAVSGSKDSATTKAAATGASSGSSGTAKIDLSITADRVTMVLAALKPATEKAQVAAAARAERATYESKRDAVQACVQNSTNGGAIPSQANMTAAQKLMDRQEALTKRYNAALLGNDLRKRAYLQDSLQVATHAYTATMFGSMAKCGPRPYAPASLVELEVMQERSGGDDGLRELTVDDPARSAMTRYQFGMVRERIALYAMGEAGLVPADKLGKEGVFTDDELAVLTSHRDELVKMAPLFKSNALTWSGTSDLRGW